MVNPYLGRESVQPLLKFEGKGLFVLCRTSNPEAGDLQLLLVSNPGNRERTGRRRDRQGLFPAVSRAIYNDPDPGQKAKAYRDRINRELDKPDRKEHGTGNNIEGDFNPEDRVVLLDDVISMASSELELVSSRGIQAVAR